MKLLCVLVVALGVCCALLSAPVSAGGVFDEDGGCGGARPGKGPEACVVKSPSPPVEEPPVKHSPRHVDKRAYLDADVPPVRAAVQDPPRVRAAAPTAADIIDATPEACGPISLRAPWGRTCINLSWMSCAADAKIGPYRVKLVPAGVMMFHGSRSLPAGVIPDNLGFYSGFQTAKRYALREEWSKGPIPLVHPFRATRRFAVVDLMAYRNQAAMEKVLKEAIRDGQHAILRPHGYDTVYPLRGITGYTGHGPALHRVSYRNHDKYAFTVLCDDWKAKGISGFYGNYDDGEFHPELMLCKDVDVIEAVPGYHYKRYSREERELLGGSPPDYDAICKKA